MSIPGTAGSEDTLGERAALLTDAVGDQLGPVGLPADVSHHVLGVADVLAQQAGSVHRQSVALPVAGAVGAGEAGDTCHIVPSNPTCNKIRSMGLV